MLKIRKIVIMLVLSVMCLSGFSQSNIRPTHYWENPYTVTPAYIDENSTAEFSIITRNQWVGFDGAPVTYFGTATRYFSKYRMQLGLKAFSDKIGYTAANNISLSYSYLVKLNEDWRMNLGIAPSYQNTNYDISKIVLENLNDPDVYNGLNSENRFNFDFGVEFVKKSENNLLRFGVAGQNLYSIFFNKTDIYNKSFKNNANFAYAVYRSCSKSDFDFSVGATGIMYSKELKLNLYQAELYGAIIYKKEECDKAKLGVFYRTPKEVGPIFTVFIKDNFSFSYSYDYNFSSIGHHSTGTHELMLRYRMGKAKPCFREEPCIWAECD
jgi:type IX secretion system PorP/SprF family membrane protein